MEELRKQETLEEAILRIKSENEYYIDEVAFESGAKWQAERMYSEEEVLHILDKFYSEEPRFIEKWFEQFKKK